ncbi:MAG TPA: serine/threonine-protein kinase, partial [Polyangiales bacterium]|nr:serine/threonine-protein kinase [Polyangiales bacterium]
MGAESVGQTQLVAGRYELKERLARGGMGEVFAAHDRSTGRAVALKRLLAGTHVVHFMREYHALSALRHPRIIEVYDYGVDRALPYYTMELLDGQDLRDLSPLPYREACRLLRDVASSLALLHARRLLHRDVSPRNVRRTSDQHCKLIDFGAMVPFGVPPNVTGTPPCVPPEALQGIALDQRADLYSLGAVAYFALTGRAGYAVTKLEELPNAWSQPVQRPKRIAAMPDELDELVMSLMSLDPMKRPKSAAEVIDWLSAIG